MKKLICALATGLLVSAGAFAQIANVKSAEKIANSEKPDFAEARRLIGEALQNEESKNDPYTWYVAGLIESKAHTAEFARLAVDQNGDRTQLYTTLEAAVPAWLKLYAIESQPNEKGKVNLKYTKKAKESLHNDHIQLFYGGVWFLQNQKYDEAIEALDKFLTVKKSELFADDKDVAAIDSNAMNSAYYAIGSASQQKQYDKVIDLYNRFGSFAVEPQNVAQWVIAAHFAKGDSLGAVPVLTSSVKAYPEDPYFLANLVTILKNNGRADEAIKLLDERISSNAKDATALLVKGSIIEDADLKEALGWYLKAAKADPANTNAFIYLGGGLYNAAAKIYENAELTQAQAQVAENLLKSAIPVLEIAYKSRPDNVKGMLGSIYYQQKMNDKHDALKAGTLEVGSPALPEGLEALIASIDLTKKAAPAVQKAEPAPAPTKKASAKRRR